MHKCEKILFNHKISYLYFPQKICQMYSSSVKLKYQTFAGPPSILCGSMDDTVCLSV